MTHWILLLLGCADKDKDSGIDDTAIVEPSDDPDTDTVDPEDTEDTDTGPDTDTSDTEDEEIDCPDDVVCIHQFPYQGSGNTSTSNLDQFDSYACSPTTNESGKELYYRITLPEDGFLGIELPENEMGIGVDVDVHLLGSKKF